MSALKYARLELFNSFLSLTIRLICLQIIALFYFDSGIVQSDTYDEILIAMIIAGESVLSFRDPITTQT